MAILTSAEPSLDSTARDAICHQDGGHLSRLVGEQGLAWDWDGWDKLVLTIVRQNKREASSRDINGLRCRKRQIKHHPTMPLLWYNSKRRYLALEARWTLVPITERYRPSLLRLGTRRRYGQVQSTSWGYNLRVFPTLEFPDGNRLLASSVGRHSGGEETVKPRWPSWRVRSHH
jgi:hypothetical protein